MRKTRKSANSAFSGGGGGIRGEGYPYNKFPGYNKLLYYIYIIMLIYVHFSVISTKYDNSRESRKSAKSAKSAGGGGIRGEGYSYNEMYCYIITSFPGYNKLLYYKYIIMLIYVYISVISSYYDKILRGNRGICGKKCKICAVKICVTKWKIWKRNGVLIKHMLKAKVVI